MRFKITLSNPNTKKIPINYQHFLSSTIYDYLYTSNIDFSTKLHSGLHIEGNKNFKFFTFSWLQIPDKKIVNSELIINSSQFCLYVSSPWNEFIQNFANGLLEKGNLRIGKEIFPIIQIETSTNYIVPEYDNTKNISLEFICLSPIVITTKKEYKGKLVKYYYKPTDSYDEITEKIKNNLLKKYKSFYNKEPYNKEFKITFDQNYIKSNNSQVLVHYIKNYSGQIFANNKELFTGSPENFSSLHKTPNQSQIDIKIPAIMCPFKAEGSPELIKFGYECGFGEENSAGFGMVKLKQYKKNDVPV